MGTEGIAWGWTSGGKCPVCGKPFEGLHMNSKKTCSSACRQKLQRYREKLDSEIIMDVLSDYELWLEIADLTGKAREQLIAAHALIGELLEDSHES